jgi:8-oxo-dGTP diphosphatase
MNTAPYICEVYSLYRLKHYRYTVIFARFQDQWVFCKHRERDTWETAGGHIEPGETPQEGAARELREETGAARFTIEPLFDFRTSGDPPDANGMVFLAQVEELGALDSRFEMERIGLFDGLPEKLTYPWIAPVLYRHLQELLYGKDESGNANG